MIGYIAPDVYNLHVTTDKKGVKKLLVQCQNALYGTMFSRLLYYSKFTKRLGLRLTRITRVLLTILLTGNR